MARLIINADDLGYSVEINDAVKKCFSLKKISGASLMPTGGAFLEAVAMLKSLGIKEIGVHLAITGGLNPSCPERGAVSSVLDKNGAFLSGYLCFAWKYLSGFSDKRHVYNEFKAQIDRVKAQGFSITHIDSHEHVHMLPGIFKIGLRLAKEYNIPYVRFPYEPSFVIFKNFGVKDILRHTVLKISCLLGLGVLKESGLGSHAGFLGHFHSGRIDRGVFEFLLGGVKDGVYEIAFHPAVVSDGFIAKYPQYANSGIELSVLEGLDQSVLIEKGVKVVSHRDVPN
ncbi:MAG: ChbG/HpnK family deacetylase [Candidatus Omnitrophica bacterium]|nr:ChbG/HpnK family deacetylase [Candidatus Omnitrophota bacterium]